MKFLSTGEFAKLCGVPKGTLLFYDKEGLLKPKYVLDNGYRRYGIEQFFEYDMLSFFKETGSSLKEIKSYLLVREQKKLLELFEEKKCLLQEAAIKLEMRQKMIENTIDLIYESLNVTYDSIEVVDTNDEFLKIMDVDIDEYVKIEEQVNLIIDFARRFENDTRYIMSNLGLMIKKEDVIMNKYSVSNIFCKIDRTVKNMDDIYIKPKGRYAVFFHSGDDNSHTSAYMKALDDIKKLGLTIIGNAYIYDMASYFSTKDNYTYITKYCIHVK